MAHCVGHESDKETGSFGSLPYMRRKTWGKVRAEHGPPPHRAAPRSAFSRFGKI